MVDERLDSDPDLQFVRARVRKASRLTRHPEARKELRAALGELAPDLGAPIEQWPTCGFSGHGSGSASTTAGSESRNAHVEYSGFSAIMTWSAVSKFVNPDTDETDCAECGDAIDIADEESVMDAILRHFDAAGHFSE